ITKQKTQASPDRLVFRMHCPDLGENLEYRQLCAWSRFGFRSAHRSECRRRTIRDSCPARWDGSHYIWINSAVLHAVVGVVADSRSVAARCSDREIGKAR